MAWRSLLEELEDEGSLPDSSAAPEHPAASSTAPYDIHRVKMDPACSDLVIVDSSDPCNPYQRRTIAPGTTWQHQRVAVGKAAFVPAR